MSPCLFNLYAEYIITNAGLDEAQAGIKTVGRNINNLRYPDDNTLVAEREEELKSLLMKLKEESEKADTQCSENEDLGIQSHHFMANRWGNNGNSEVKRRLLLGRKAMTNLGSILKSRDITLPTKVLVKAMAFPIVMYTCESWTIKKADAEELMLLNCGVEEDS